MTLLRFLLTSVSLLVTAVVYPQANRVSIKFEENELIHNSVALSKGLLMNTGVFKGVDWKLSFYSPDLNLVWETPKVTAQGGKGFINLLIASEHTDYVYHLEPLGRMKLTGYHITQIDDTGEIKSTTFTNVKDFGELYCTFATKDYLVFMTTKNGNVKRGKQQLVLNRIRNSDFRYSSIILDLPLENTDGNESDWEIVEYSADRILIGSKKIAWVKDKKDKTAKYFINEFDLDGKLLRKTVLDLTGDTFISPAKNVRNEDGTRYYNDGFINDYDGRSHYRPTYWSYGTVQSGPDGTLYVYTLTHTKPDLMYFSGYTIQKFDWSGTRLWKDDKSFGQDIKNSAHFNGAHHLASLTNLYFIQNNDKSLSAQVFLGSMAFAQNYSADGKLIASEAIGADRDLSLNPKDKIEPADYKLKKQLEKNPGLNAYLSAQPDKKVATYEFEKSTILRQWKAEEKALLLVSFIN